MILKEYDDWKSVKYLFRKSMDVCLMLFIPLNSDQHIGQYILSLYLKMKLKNETSKCVIYICYNGQYGNLSNNFTSILKDEIRSQICSPSFVECTKTFGTNAKCS